MRGAVATSFGPSALATPANAVTISLLPIAFSIFLLFTSSWPSMQPL